MLADLDKQISDNDPEVLSQKDRQLHEAFRIKIKQLDKIASSQGEESQAFQELYQEIEKNLEAQKIIDNQIIPAMRRNHILRHKRNILIHLLQTLSTIRQEGNWPQYWEEDKNGGTMMVNLGIMELIAFSTFKPFVLLEVPAIHDIKDWMEQHHIPIPFPVTEEKVEAHEEKRKPQKKRPVKPATPTQIEDKQAWVRLLTSAHQYSSHFQDPLGETGVFTYDEKDGNPSAFLYLWAEGAKQKYAVTNGVIEQQDELTHTMSTWLSMCWAAAAVKQKPEKPSKGIRKKKANPKQTDEKPGTSDS